MVKTFTYLCVLLVLITGCSEDEKVLLNYEDTYDVSIFNYKFFNLDGIDLSKEFVDIYNGKTISFSDGGKLEYLGHGKISIMGDEAHNYWSSLWQSTYYKLDFFEYRPDDSKFLYMSGIRGNKIWVGKFDESKKEQVDEWYCKDEIENHIIKYDMGYGKEGSLTAQGVHVRKVSDDYFLLDINLIDMVLMKDNLCGYYFKSIYHVQKWFNDSYLISTDDFSNIYDNEGKGVIKYGKKVRSTYNSNIPVSYTTYLSCDRTYIMLDDLTKGDYIWYENTPFGDLYPDATKMTYEVIDRSTNVWKLLCTALKVDGDEDKIIFTVNLENGDMVVL